jgi:hypothetical protein
VINGGKDGNFKKLIERIIYFELFVLSHKPTKVILNLPDNWCSVIHISFMCIQTQFDSVLQNKIYY